MKLNNGSGKKKLFFPYLFCFILDRECSVLKQRERKCVNQSSQALLLGLRGQTGALIYELLPAPEISTGKVIQLCIYPVSSTYTALIIQMKTDPVWYRWLYP